MTRQIGGRTVADGRTLNGSTALDEQGAHSPATTIADVSQIPGIRIAHHTDEENGTGCTVIVCPAGATGAVDVRGGAPATRETDLLHAVVLSGGSAYGLAASVGVAEELERRGIGLDVQVGVVPIVSGACLFDLAFANPNVRPTAADGARACALALDNAPTPLPRGNVGAGCGCTVGKLGGPTRAMKSGLGTDVEQAGPLLCGAVAAVNMRHHERTAHEGPGHERVPDGRGCLCTCDTAHAHDQRRRLRLRHGDGRGRGSRGRRGHPRDARPRARDRGRRS